MTKTNTTIESNLIPVGSGDKPESSWDVAFGVRDRLLNNFLEAHFKKFRNKFYLGKGEVEQIRINYEWKIKSPAKLYFESLTESDLEAYRQYVLADEEQAQAIQDEQRIIDLLKSNVPQIKIHLPKVEFRLTLLRREPFEIVIPVQFFALTKIKLENNVLKLIPEAAHILDLEESLGEATNNEELLLVLGHITNTLLRDNLSQLVQQIEIPNVLEVFDSAKLSNLGVIVREHHLILTSTVNFPQSQMAESNLISNSKTTPRSNKSKISGKSLRDSILPNRDLFIALNGHFFQLLAERYLTRTDRGHVEEWKQSPKYRFDYELHVNDPQARIEQGKIKLDCALNFKITKGDFEQGRLVKFNWKANGKAPKGIQLNGELMLKRQGRRASLWAKATLLPFKPDVKFEVDDWILDSILSLSEDFVALLFKSIQAVHPIGIEHKILDFPSIFPGTSLRFRVSSMALHNFDGNVALLSNLDFSTIS
jgi:hypothetical protein